MNNRGKSLLSKSITIAAWTSLLMAFIYGKFISREDYESVLRNQQPELIIHEYNDGKLTVADNDTSVAHIRYGKAQGYGGELVVGVQYGSGGKIEEVHLLKQRETNSFMTKLESNKFFRQFPSKSIADELVIDSDVDAVSGCTVSSVAFTEAIRNASYEAAKKDFSWPVSHPAGQWIFGLSEIAVLLLIITGILAIYLKKKWLRYSAMIISVALVGFHLNASLSISHFARLLLGFLPGLKEHFAWWVLLATAIGFPFFLKKNLYCYALCPFHAVETALIKISGFQLKLTRGFQKITKHVSLALLWMAFVLIFVSENPTLGSYEPFALLFSLNGAGLQWYLLPAALIGAMLIPDFYCRYFCPVGRTLNLVLKAGNRIRSIIFREQASPEAGRKIKTLTRTIRRAS